MFKKVCLTFFTLLILFSVLAGCGQIQNPAVAPSQEIVHISPTPEVGSSSPTPEAITDTLEIRLTTDTPASVEKTDPASIKEIIVTREVFKTLSSPQLEGRVMGSPGGEMARAIIVDLFSDMGLKPFNKEFTNPIFINPSQSAVSYNNNKGDGYNVVGFLPRKNSKECLVISAHYDGADNDTAALDNAAGVYALLKTAEKLSSTSKNQDFSRDIVLAAFDGEEAGLIGSSYLVDQVSDRYEKTVVINFDCVGIKGSDSYMVIGNPLQFKPLIDSIYQQLKSYHFVTVPVNEFFGSDHLSFEWQGIPAVTIGERDVEGIVHSTNDVADKVDLNEIERLSEAVYTYVLGQADALYETLYP